MQGLIVHQILDRTVQAFPNQAVVSGSTRLTYAQFYDHQQGGAAPKIWRRRTAVTRVDA